MVAIDVMPKGRKAPPRGNDFPLPEDCLVDEIPPRVTLGATGSIRERLLARSLR